MPRVLQPRRQRLAVRMMVRREKESTLILPDVAVTCRKTSSLVLITLALSKCRLILTK